MKIYDWNVDWLGRTRPIAQVSKGSTSNLRRGRRARGLIYIFFSLNQSSLRTAMASPSLPSSSLLSRFSSAQSSPPITSFTVFSGKQRFIYHPRRAPGLSIRALTLDFSGSFFEGGFGSDDDPNSPPGPGIAAVEDKDEPQCPPGLRQYETMAVLRPDMSEDERLALTQKYEEVRKSGLCLVAEKTRARKENWGFEFLFWKIVKR